MKSKRRLLQGSRLYLVADAGVLEHRRASGFIRRVRAAGIDMIQLRDKVSSRRVILKNVRELRNLLAKTNTLLIVNDHVDIARFSASDGVHLGQNDISTAVARALLGPEAIIGRSTHSLAQAREAVAGGADYISIGPVFATATKPEYRPVGLRLARQVAKEIKIPVFAIGGLDRETIPRLDHSGIRRIAVCGAICRAKKPAAEAKALKRMLASFNKS